MELNYHEPNQPETTTASRHHSLPVPTHCQTIIVPSTEMSTRKSGQNMLKSGQENKTEILK
ncbi:MAG: hypothetical protein LBQ50_13875 [Planctomycetaceae bacterium]|jgi:hypothetical protein|nr:hypothetical protein [Planctomycetaceae bacterium]